MTVSSDKVQFILEGVLQDSLPLVKKGVFSQVELRQSMAKRDQQERAMLKNEHQVTDYLAAIEYEYSLERERRSRMQNIAKEEVPNPLMRKEGGGDFVIVKRIYRLWDRTMHKYRFRPNLWKQYLQFCITSGSKKHFYKALTNALRFMPFEVDLWKVGAAYEQQIGHNMWKGRKLLIKGLKMIPPGQGNIQLGQFMVLYEVQFLKLLVERQAILAKGDQPLKFVGQAPGEQPQSEEIEEVTDPLKLEDYDQVIWLVIEEIIRKNTSKQLKSLSQNSIKKRMTQTIQGLIEDQSQDFVVQTLKKVQKRLLSLESGDKEMVVESSVEKVPLAVSQIQRVRNDQDRLEQWKVQLSANDGSIDWNVIESAVRSFCLKPHYLGQLYDFLLKMNQTDTVSFLLMKKNNVKLPTQFLITLLQEYLSHYIQLSQSQRTQFTQYLSSQVDRKVEPKDFKDNFLLLKTVLKYNNHEQRGQATIKLLRSLRMTFKMEPQFIEQVNQLANSLEH